MRIMKFTSLEKVGTAKYWLRKRGLILETWIEEDLPVCIEEALNVPCTIFCLEPVNEGTVLPAVKTFK